MTICIVSAEFGLIGASTLIPCYDRQMTMERANELRHGLRDSLLTVWKESKFQEAFACLGSVYCEAMSEGLSALPEDVTVRRATGSIGGQASKLSYWLNGNSLSSERADRGDSHSTVNSAVLCGVRISMSRSSIDAIATKGLIDDPGGASRFQTWYVAIGDNCVAPKWLASRLTGLPVAKFRSAGANRFLVQLGMEIRFNEQD